jgi:hypothetical protein
LRDTWGYFRHPAELLCRTPETETLLDTEAFVRADIDTEGNRPILLLLGVRNTPTGPAALIERLKALSQSAAPPLQEVEKWYRRIEQMIGYCSTDDAQVIKDVFQSNRIVFTESDGWVYAREAFIAADDDDVPGAALVHPSFRNLALWHRVGIAERPTIELRGTGG